MTLEDGWELVEKVPEKIFKDSILSTVETFILTDNLTKEFLEMFKKKIDFLFNKTYCKYFNFVLQPKLFMSTLNILIKLFLYACTLGEKQNSFNCLMNEGVKSGGYLKMKKYIDIVAMINTALK